MKQKMKRVLWMLVSFTTVSINSAVAIEVNIDGLTYELSGVSAKVVHVASGNTNTIIQVPSTVAYGSLTYIVNEVGANCFSNVSVSKTSYYGGGYTTYQIFEKGKSIGWGERTDGELTRTGIYLNESLWDDSWTSIANSYATEVSLPETIEHIGENAFCNTQIQKIHLSEGIQQIDKNAFNTPQLDKICLPASLKSIGRNAFYNAKITELSISSSLTDMGAEAFTHCSLLRKITYLAPQAPLHWIATSITYVPSKKTYSDPSYSINNASIIEMISFSDNTFTYTGKAPNVTWTNNVDGYTANLAIPTLHSEVGTYEEVIPATFTNGEETFTAYIPYSYTIEPAKLTARVNDASRVYGEDDPVFTINYTGFVNNEDVSVLTTQPTVSTTANTNSDIGTYPLTLCGGKAKNYTFEYEEGTLTINKATLTINVDNATKVYGKENPAFSLSYSGLKNNETAPAWTEVPTFTTEAIETSDVGTYAVNVTCEPKNYEATIKSGTLSITQAPLTIGVGNATRAYCGNEPEYSYIYSGFVNGDEEDVLTQKPIIQTEATYTSNVGDYTITPTGAQAKNYAISYESGTLTITQVLLTVRAVSETRNYGKENPDFSLIYEGFVNNETKDVLLSLPTASTSATFNSNAGTYDIRVSGGRAFNYTLKYESGQLIVNPVPLKISVGSYERPYNEENPDFNLVYEGLAANDTKASLQTQPVVRTTATKTSDTGTYTLEVAGAYSPNYTITYQSGTLTVVKAEQTLGWEQDLSLLIVDDQIELKAAASSGLPVTYTMEEIDGAEIYTAGRKTYLECKAPCEFVIKAVQNGNSNYYSTQRITKRVKIVSEEEYEKEKEKATAIGGVKAENDDNAIRYNMNGQPISSPQKGVNIIRYSDGTVKKVYVK